MIDSQTVRAIRGRDLSIPLLFFLAAVVVGFYLFVSYLQNGAFGFPLDDAWIHQVYARNLGTRLEFSFFAGEPSAGSTSPLWAVLLGIGYALGVDYRVWAVLLGVVLLAGTGWMGQRAAGKLTDDLRVARWFVPLLLVTEWHLVWAAVSGMEILLFVFLALALVDAFFRAVIGEDNKTKTAGYVWMGALAGLLTLTRPEGVLLAGLVGLGLVVGAARNTDWVGVVKVGGLFGIAFAVVIAPYLVFNWQTVGTLLPNTFYAKGAEYAELTTQTNFFARWLAMYRQPLIGAQLLLVPGLVFGVVAFARARDWVRVLPALWILLLPALYAWRLPVEYQFGRYMMPIIPFVILYGTVGTAMLFGRIRLRLVLRAWAATIAVLAVVFLGLGANLYAQSVGIINCEMVAVAKWTRENVPQGALLAVHDIGAQGYFDEHPMLDLAGLVSPEVIPFMRDEARLKEWMLARGARYAVFFPTWYPLLATDAQFKQIYSTGCAVTREMDEENLGVYALE